WPSATSAAIIKSQPTRRPTIIRGLSRGHSPASRRPQAPTPYVASPPRAIELLGPSPLASLAHPGASGGVAERLKAHAWKACIGEPQPGVGTPPPPPASPLPGRFSQRLLK